MKTPEELVHDYENMDTTSKEPALKQGGIISAIYLVGTIIAMFIPSMDSLSPNVRSILTIVSLAATVIIPFFLSYIIRGQVWSPASVAVLIKQLESAKAQFEHPIDNLSKDFFSGDVKHNHPSYTDCTEICPRHPDHIQVNDAPEL